MSGNWDITGEAMTRESGKNNPQVSSPPKSLVEQKMGLTFLPLRYGNLLTLEPKTITHSSFAA